ncbi:hypothetical protein UZ36_07250 [Candidatus Nitromaritima sp. SCGC AAA799-C22]|nr:hypothetical protein UZ36_07250 [Candidatus Nitromaritima sp. SCGC AAA799-C22]
MWKKIIPIVAMLTALSGIVSAKPLLVPDKHTTAYLDLVGSISNEHLALGTDIDLALEPNGDLIIADPNNKRVLRVNPDNALVQSKLFAPLIGGTIGKPRRVAHGRRPYWVADPDRHEIAKIGLENNILWHARDFDSPFDKVSDISTGPDGSLLVLDNGKASVFKISLDGKVRQVFQASRDRDRNWSGISSSGSLTAIADEGAQALWIIDATGGFKLVSLKKNDINPVDLAENKGRFVVADRSGMLWEISPDGRGLTQMALASKYLLEPTRLSAAGGRVAVWDAAQKRILIFSEKYNVTSLQHLLMGEEFLEVGLPSLALGELIIARAQGMDSKDLFLFEGRAYYELRDYKKARPAFEELIKRSPDDMEGRFWLGNCFLKLRNFLKAIAQYIYFLGRNPDHVPTLTNLGIALASMGNWAEAEAHFERAIQLSPDSPEANLGFGQWLIVKRNFTKAEEVLTVFYQKRPDVKEVAHYLGLAYAGKKDCKKAIPFLETASKTGPFFSEALLALGRCYLTLGDIDSAKAAFIHVLQIKPEHPGAKWELSKIQGNRL